MIPRSAGSRSSRIYLTHGAFVATEAGKDDLLGHHAHLKTLQLLAGRPYDEHNLK